MSWNYRIVKNGKKGYYIKEVYYNEDNGKIEAFSEITEPYGETIDDLKKDLEKMVKAFEKPVIELENEI